MLRLVGTQVQKRLGRAAALTCASMTQSSAAAAPSGAQVVPPATSAKPASSTAQTQAKRNHAVGSSSPHKLSSNTSDASAYVGNSSDDIPSYSAVQHAGYLALHSRRLWLPLLMCGGYYAMGPVFAAAGAASTVQQCAYLTACVIAQRLSVHGRSNKLTKDMRGYTCVVTGGTSGIGLYTAMQLLDMGANVTIASKSGKEEATMQFFMDNCQVNPTFDKAAVAGAACEPLEKRVTFISMDYNDQVDVMAAAARIKGRFDNSIDLLVNCAAVWTEDPAVTKQNFEEHIGVNFLGPFHLTEALLPALRRSRKKCGRVVYVTCASHNGVRTAKVVEERMLLKPSVDTDQITARCYSASKLGNIYHAQSIALRRYEGIPLNHHSASGLHPVDVCCVDPGFCFTNLQRNRGGGRDSYGHEVEVKPVLGTSVFGRVLRSLWIKDAYEGSQTVVNCCVRDDLEQGSYYAECAHMPSGLSKRAQDPKAREDVIRWAMAKTIAKYYKTE